MVAVNEFNKYQQLAHTTAVYPPEMGMAYCITGLCAEAGEVADKIAKYYSGMVTLMLRGYRKS